MDHGRQFLKLFLAVATLSVFVLQVHGALTLVVAALTTLVALAQFAARHQIAQSAVRFGFLLVSKSKFA